MQAGKLKRIIQIQRATSGKTEGGHATQGPYVNLFPGKTIKAEIIPAGTTEAVNGKQIEVVKQYKLTLRHPKRSETQVTEQHRVVFDGKSWGIVSADNVDMAYRTLVLTVKELKK